MRDTVGLTSAKVSKRGRWSHFRNPRDLAKRVMSVGLSSGTLGSSSAAIRWNTWEWLKFNFPTRKVG